jgi:nucleotide-binding universal stress UspA family protein
MKMKLIVAAIDFSPASSAALRRAAELAAASGARLALLHVARHRSPLAALNREAARIRAEHRIVVEAHLAKGAAHKEIAAFARASGADLVVLGLRRGFLQDLLGSATAQRVRHRLAVPVLAVTREPRGPYRRILVATDLSPASARGTHTALRMFPHASVRLLHVSRPPFDSKLSLGGVSERGREEYRRSAAMQAMVSLGAFAERANLGRALLEVRLGSADAVLRERAEQVGADLLVLAPSRKSWLERLILFGTTDAMLSHAEHDVLIAPWLSPPLGGELRLVVDPGVLAASAAVLRRGAAGVQHAVAGDGEGKPAP